MDEISQQTNECKPIEWHIEQGFKLSFHFLDRHCYVPRGIKPPQERYGLIKRIMRAMLQES